MATKMINEQRWFTPACRSAVSTGFPLSGLLADGPAKLRQQQSALVPSYVQAGPAAVTGGHSPVLGSPAFPAMREQIEHATTFANGGLRGPQPWRRPVKT